MKIRCRAYTLHGKPCARWAMDSGYCFSHDPGKQEERAAAFARISAGQVAHHKWRKIEMAILHDLDEARRRGRLQALDAGAFGGGS